MANRTPPMVPETAVQTVTDALPQGELARKLTRLFLLHPHDRKPYSPAAVAKAINTAAGKHIISDTYLWQLKVGRKDNPTATVLRALAGFFRVPGAYLLGGDEELDRRTDAELDDLELMQKLRVRQVAYQMAALPEDGQAAVQDLAMRIAELSPDARGVMLQVLSVLEGASKLAKGASSAIRKTL